MLIKINTFTIIKPQCQSHNKISLINGNRSNLFRNITVQSDLSGFDYRFLHRLYIKDSSFCDNIIAFSKKFEKVPLPIGDKSGQI